MLIFTIYHALTFFFSYINQQSVFSTCSEIIVRKYEIKIKYKIHWMIILNNFFLYIL